MQKVEYKFADGTESAVEVSDELHAVIEALEKESRLTPRLLKTLLNSSCFFKILILSFSETKSSFKNFRLCLLNPSIKLLENVLSVNKDKKDSLSNLPSSLFCILNTSTKKLNIKS